MPRNVEIKARIEDFDALLSRVASLADSGPTEIDQEDTFFRCANGRLKVRDFNDGTGELIFYRRSDRRGPKQSLYLISPTCSALRVSIMMSRSACLAGTSEKKRW